MSDAKPRRGCLWPMWPHESRPTHEYCGKHRADAGPYCQHHKRMSIRNLETEPRQVFVPRKAA